MKRISKAKLKVLCLLLSAVMMLNMSAIAIAADDPEPEVDTSSVILNKSAKLNPDGTVRLTVETYLTGTVKIITEETETPSDIVLVLDYSMSMRESFGSGASATTKTAALTSAVTKFIEDAGKRYDADKTDHLISIVSFSSNAALVSDWKNCNASGVSALKSSIATMNLGASTNVAAGLNMAGEQLAKTYTGSNKDRRQIVVLFTDGYPAQNVGQYSAQYAENGVAAAKTLKDKGILIFDVGIFDRAAENVYYGSKAGLTAMGFSMNNIGARGGSNGCTVYDYADSDAVDSAWYLNSNDNNYLVLANRFMSFVSSNFPTAAGMGVSSATTQKTWRTGSRATTYYGSKITASYKQDSDSYYLTAADSDELSNAFERISTTIKETGTVINLGKETVVKDIVSDYFELPEGATVSDIDIYTADCIGKSGDTFLFQSRDDWAKSPAGVTATITDWVKSSGDRRNISVTGFDFTSNVVAYDETTSTATGKKLIVEFDIEPIDGFSGGNNVPTNNPASGVYPSATSEPLVRYPEPEVCLPITQETTDLEIPDHVIYQGNSVCVDPTVELDDRDPILDAFNERTVYIDTEGTGNYVKIANGYFSPNATKTYPKNSVKIVVAPKEDKNAIADGAEATSVEYYNDAPFTIYVLEPSVAVTANDTAAYYGDTYTLGTGANADFAITWKDPSSGKTVADVDEGQIAPLVKDDLKIVYSATGFTNGSGTIGKKTLDVSMALVSNDENEDPYPTDNVTYSITCDKGCTSPRTTGGMLYKVHSNTCSLTVVNKGGKATETFVYRVLKDGNPYTTVTVKGGTSSSVTLKELPVGSYTLVPASDWSWRYTPSTQGATTATLTSANTSGTLTVVQTAKSTNLFGGMTALISNIFGGGK